MITIRSIGNYRKTEEFLKKSLGRDYVHILEKYAKEGVRILSQNTPVDTGKTSQSWSYEIEETKNTISVVWTNSNINDGVNIAVLIQYGHATKNGGYVQGLDYINPSLQPIFEELADACWKEVTKS